MGQLVEIEKYPWFDSKEATSRERYWFEILNANMNTQYPNRCKNEWDHDNIQKIKNNKKQYHIDNIITIKDK